MTCITGTGVPAKGDEGAVAALGARRIYTPLRRKMPWAVQT